METQMPKRCLGMKRVDRNRMIRSGRSQKLHRSARRKAVGLVGHVMKRDEDQMTRQGMKL